MSKMEKCEIAKELLEDVEDLDEVSDCETIKCTICNKQQCYHEALDCHLCLKLTCANSSCITSDHLNVCKNCSNNDKPHEIVPGSLVDILSRILPKTSNIKV